MFAAFEVTLFIIVNQNIINLTYVSGQKMFGKVENTQNFREKVCKAVTGTPSTRRLALNKSNL
jgi:hypothetical protein